MTDLLHDRVVAAIGDFYEVSDELGRGGMAVVYRARDVRLRREVAIKVLPPELAYRGDVRTRFLREAETAAQLSHPNIVPIYSVDERGGVVFFVMALVRGESLAALLARAPRPPHDAVRRILRDVADALAYAHSRGVVHRDIKPDNILLESEGGRPMVTDFGIARAAEAESRLTVTGVAVGTPAYMSPEQALGERDVDARSDVYSLGVVGYQMLTGELPFKAANTPAMLMKHLSERPRVVTELCPEAPRAMAAAVDRALAKSVHDRWPDAAAFRDALSAASPMPPPASERPFPQQWPAGRREGPPLSRRESREVAREERHESRIARRGWRRRFDERPVAERVVIFRRELAGTGATLAGLTAINLMTHPQFLWVVFPAVGMGMSVMRKAASLWADGVRWREVFGVSEQAAPPALADAGSSTGRGAGDRGALAAPPTSGAPAGAAAALVPPEVLDGVHGAAVRRAAADRAAIADTVARLGPADRELLPDVAPTVDALVERIAALAQALHRLDVDVTPETLSRLGERIAAVEREPGDAPDRERKLALLNRQRATIEDLVRRREKLLGRLESAGLILQNLRFDLLKLRSSGVQASIDEITSATQEARSLSREIGTVLDAAAEVRALT